jgi:phage gpG-like protein
VTYFGARLTIPRSDVEHVREVVRRWDHLEFALREFAKWWAERRIVDVFRSGGFPGAKWAKNRPATIAAKGHASPLVSARGIVAGTLAKSFRAYVRVASSRRYEVTTTNTKPYAAYHNEGRGVSVGESAWTIVPHPPKQYLRFVGGDGGIVYAKSVRHPGYPRRPFMFFTADDVREINRLVRQWVRVPRGRRLFRLGSAPGVSR